jgi:fibronectin type 3 domain-containing protein
MRVASYKIKQTKVIFLVFAAVVGFCFLLGGNQKAAAAACNIPATTYGTDTLSVSAPATGTYYLWIREQAPSVSNSSLLAQVDGNTCFSTNLTSSQSANTWYWENLDVSTPMTLSLSQGTHSVELIGVDSGVAVELLEAAPADCTPSDTGDNCAPTDVAPPTVSFSTPANQSTVSGSSVPISVNASSASGVSQVGINDVVIEIDGNIVATLNSAPFNYTWNTTQATNGAHTLTAVATDTQGQSTTTSESVTVQNTVACSAAPGTPSNFSGTSSSPTSVTLTWSAGSVPAGCTITKYSVTQGGTVVDTPTGLSQTVTGLSPNKSYSFTLSDSDSNGTSAPTSAINVSTQADTTPPTAPTNATATVKNAGEVDLSWAASTDNIGVQYYKITRTSSSGSVTLSTNYPATTYADTSVASNTTYTYSIVAVDTSGNASTPATTFTPLSVTTPKVTNTNPPSAPSNLTSPLITANQVDLTWQASTPASGNTISSYKVYRGTTAVGTVTNLTNLSYVDTGLSSSTSYSYDVVAIDNNGNVSKASSTLTATTQPGHNGISFCIIPGDTAVGFAEANKIFALWSSNATSIPLYNYDGTGVVDFGDANFIFSAWAAGDKC